MPGLYGNNRAAQVYNASGEATEQEKLPGKFVSNPPATSPIADHLDTPTDYTSFVPGQPNFVVRRWPRMVGMRYLYARGMSRIPIQNVGADGAPYPHISAFQPNNIGPIRNAGFNDKLFQAGIGGTWPFAIGGNGHPNLELSYKVAQIDRSDTQAANPHSTTLRSAKPVSLAVNRLRRSPGRPSIRETQ